MTDGGILQLESGGSKDIIKGLMHLDHNVGFPLKFLEVSSPLCTKKKKVCILELLKAAKMARQQDIKNSQ